MSDAPADSPFEPRYRWLEPPDPPPSLLAALPDVPPAVVSALVRRGLADPGAARRFLDGAWADDDPFALAGMQQAVMRLRQAVRNHEPVAVYGDFDADGVTATALLTETLRGLGARVITFIPHRERDGYGVHQAALGELADQGVKVVVTVDCGIRAGEEVAYARSRGLDIIVTDHHVLPEELPDAVAVINPRRPDCGYGFADLAGVGLAYKLAQALLRVEQSMAPSRGPTLLMLNDHPLPSEEDLLDLVALGTVADVVPLVGENRALVRLGLDVLRTGQRRGVAALCAAVGVIPESLTAHDLGHALAPRLNAAGRMGGAEKALALLLTRDVAEAEGLARELNRINDLRRMATEEALSAAEAALAGRMDEPFLLVANADMAMGVVGLVAGRLAERNYRPAAAVRIEGEFARGSARSIPEFNIVSALDACADLLVRHGGHARAAGFTVRTEHLPELAARLRAAAQAAFEGQDLRRTLAIDAVLAPGEIHWGLYRGLRALEPFGEGNPRPTLLVRQAIVTKARRVGSRHLKLSFLTNQGLLDAIAFGQADRFDNASFAIPDLVRADLVGVLRAEVWNGAVRMEMRVDDMVACRG